MYSIWWENMDLLFVMLLSSDGGDGVVDGASVCMEKENRIIFDRSWWWTNLKLKDEITYGFYSSFHQAVRYHYQDTHIENRLADEDINDYIRHFLHMGC